MRRRNEATDITRREWLTILCWFVPALAAFCNAYLLMPQERDPFVKIVPVLQTSIGETRPLDDKPLKVTAFKAIAEFENEQAGNLNVELQATSSLSIPGQPNPLYATPTYHVTLLRDGEYISSVSGITAGFNTWLNKGKHRYRVETTVLQVEPMSLSSNASLKVAMSYPIQESPWRGFGLLGLAFFIVGVIRLARRNL